MSRAPRPADSKPHMKTKVSREKRNNYIIIIFDSCRYDTLLEARPKTIKKLGPIEQRWSYASWTAPSHYNLLMGLLPHSSPKQVFASEYYKQDFLRFNERLGSEGISFRSLVPQLYFPAFLKESLGYRTNAMVSLPVLNPRTIINNGFDTFKLMDKHNDMRAMVKEMQFPEDQPSFHLLNVGETHYPYALPDEPPENWPRISGIHGVFKHLDDQVVGGKLLVKSKDRFFKKAEMKMLRDRQVKAVKYLDRVVEELFEIVPKNTYVTITADHGELFGESGFFGHGPIVHRKVFEVPFVEGKVR
jgi:hypothetical protein